MSGLTRLLRGQGKTGEFDRTAATVRHSEQFRSKRANVHVVYLNRTRKLRQARKRRKRSAPRMGVALVYLGMYINQTPVVRPV